MTVKPVCVCPWTRRVVITPAFSMEEIVMKIDTEKAIIWGANGGAGYCINDSGGLELSDIIEGGLSEDEEAAARKELEK